MKKANVQVGGEYLAKVSGNLARVKLTNESPHGGWDAVNLATGRTIRIRTAARLRRNTSEALQAAFASLEAACS